MPVELGGVVLGVEGEEAAVAGGVAFFGAVEDRDALAKCRSHVITKACDVAVSAGCRIEEEYRLEDALVGRPCRTNADAYFLLLDPEAPAKGAPQGDPERKRGPGIDKAFELKLEDVGGPASAE